MFCYKIHRTRIEKYELVVGICDKGLVGKKIRENPPFVVNEKFYFDKECNEDAAIKLLQICTIANIIGEEIIKLALEKKFITKENIILIEGIPHAQLIK